MGSVCPRELGVADRRSHRGMTATSQVAADNRGNRPRWCMGIAAVVAAVGLCLGLGWAVAWHRAKASCATRASASQSTLLSQGYSSSWSPDSKWIAHDMIGPEGYLEVCVSEVQSLVRGRLGPLPGAVQVVAKSRGGNATDPAWSPDGSWIAFLQYRATQSSLWVARAPGATAPGRSVEPVDITTGLVVTSPPRWSPDSSTIALSYQEPVSDQPLVGTVAVLPGGDWPSPVTLVTRSSPSIVPVQLDCVPGGQLVFQQDHEGSVGLDLLDIRTKSTRRLTAGPWDAGPVASPDGAWIAYISEFDGDAGPAGLYVVSTDGGDPIGLTPVGTGCGPPAWSPDSRRLALFARDPGSNWCLHIVSAPDRRWEGGQAQVRPIPQEDGIPGTTSWSPDGNLIAFSVTAAGSDIAYLRVIDAPGAQ